MDLPHFRGRPDLPLKGADEWNRPIMEDRRPGLGETHRRAGRRGKDLKERKQRAQGEETFVNVPPSSDQANDSYFEFTQLLKRFNLGKLKEKTQKAVDAIRRLSIFQEEARHVTEKMAESFSQVKTNEPAQHQGYQADSFSSSSDSVNVQITKRLQHLLNDFKSLETRMATIDERGREAMEEMQTIISDMGDDIETVTKFMNEVPESRRNRK